MNIPECFGEAQEESARALFLQNRGFLRQLCELDSWRKSAAILAAASNEQLNVLALVVYLTYAKHIHLSHNNKEELITKKKTKSIITLFGDRDKYNTFLTLDRAEKLQRLKRVGHGIVICLRPLFYRQTKPNKVDISE